MRLLLATDLHFSDRPRDRYRFDFIPHLRNEIERLRADMVIILGDLTDKKDNHSSILVNLIVAGLRSVAAMVPVVVLKGNHDYQADPSLPFFKFLNHIEGLRFIVEPAMIGDLYMVPHIKTAEEWAALRPTKAPTAAFIHQTVSGAISESGQRLDGMALKPMKRLGCPVFSGDVHKPQTIGPVIYIGPPYHIRFGDNFNPRYMLFDTMKMKRRDLHFDCPRKWSLTVREASELINSDKIKSGDQVKVRLELTREELPEWSKMKDQVNEALKFLEVENFGVELKVQKQTKVRKKAVVQELQRKDPSEVIRDFSKHEKLPSLTRDIGLEILRS